MVTDGFRCASEMWPMDKTTIVIARPEHAALPRSVSESGYFWFTTGAAAAENIRMKMLKCNLVLAQDN
ncbi:hypothetical protein EV1_045463 [Malus domestica]